MNTLQHSKRVHIYLFVSKGFARLSDLPKPLSGVASMIEALWRAIWLGLLEADALNEITWAYYMGGSGFEDEEFNTGQGLWPWEASAIQNYFHGHQRVLVAGAGGGREVIALIRLGHEVTAFDFSSFLT